MKSKALNLLLIITSLIGYLEWGNNNSSFLFQAEYEVIKGLFSNMGSVAHPFTLIPLIGQILIFITLFQKEPSRTLSYIGMACLALLLGFMLLIGAFAMNFKIFISTIPFFLVVLLVVRNFKLKRNSK